MRTEHVQRPAQINADIMQHRAESCREDSKKDNAIMTPSDDVGVLSSLVEICSIHVEADDRAYRNNLC